MKKLGFAAFAVSLLAVLLSCGSSAPAQRAAARPGDPAFTGDGGRGIRMAVLVPESEGLAEDQGYLPALVQGVLVDNFSRFSAISVLDRMALESVLTETESGIYRTDAEFGELGEILAVDYVLTGRITRTGAGHTLNVRISGTGTHNIGVNRASFNEPLTAAQMSDHTGVRRASMQLLTGMGVALTDNARQELSGADTRQAITAQVALAQGIVAQRAGNTFETLLRFNEAAALDPTLTEAVTRAYTVTSGVRIGTLAQDIRDQIERDELMRNEWTGIMNEAWAFFSAQSPVVARVVYDPARLTHTGTDWDRELATFTLPVYFFGTSFPAAHIQVMNDLNMGLWAAGGRAGWGVEPLSPTNVWYTKMNLRHLEYRVNRRPVQISVRGSLWSGGRWHYRIINQGSRQMDRFGNITTIDNANARTQAVTGTGTVDFRQNGTAIEDHVRSSIELTFTVPVAYLNGEMRIRLSASGTTPANVSAGGTTLIHIANRDFPVEVMTAAEFRQVFAAEGGLPPMRTHTIQHSRPHSFHGTSQPIVSVLQVEIPNTHEKQFGLAFRHEFNDGHGLWLPEIRHISVDTTDFRFPVSVGFISGGGEILRIIDMRPGQTATARSGERFALIVPQGWFGRNDIRAGDPARRGRIQDTGGSWNRTTDNEPWNQYRW